MKSLAIRFLSRIYVSRDSSFNDFGNDSLSFDFYSLLVDNIWDLNTPKNYLGSASIPMPNDALVIAKENAMIDGDIKVVQEIERDTLIATKYRIGRLYVPSSRSGRAYHTRLKNVKTKYVIKKIRFLKIKSKIDIFET